MNRHSKLAIGTVQFGLDYGISNSSGKTTFEEVKKILETAFDQGIKTLDTASVYGDSETVLGNAGSERFDIISKFPGSVLTKEDLNLSLNNTLSLLKLKNIYGYLAHDADSIYNNLRIWEALQEAKQKGIVSKIGFSLYTPEQLEKLLAANCIPDIIQTPYNFLDRRFENYFPELKNQNCEIHVRSAFLQGLFFLSPANLSEYFSPIKPILEEIQSHFENSDSMVAFLINFVIENKYIDKLVLGVNSQKQLLQNIYCLSLHVNSSLVEKKYDVSEKILIPSYWPK